LPFEVRIIAGFDKKKKEKGSRKIQKEPYTNPKCNRLV
jgi:hypothetical protein